MRKTLIGLAVIASIAAPVAIAGSASADTPGTLDTTTYVNGTHYDHHFAADYTCGVVDGHAVVNFTMTGVTPSGSGSGILTPDTTGGGTFEFHGDNNGYWYNYGGAYDAHGAWTRASATAPDGTYGFGTGGATNTTFGSVVGSFTQVPNCTVDAVVPAGNHGEYVSGATKAGVKGKDLAAIAKNVALVGPYKG